MFISKKSATLFAVAFLVLSGCEASADCAGRDFYVQLGTEKSAGREMNGDACVIIPVNSPYMSDGSIYGAEIVSPPQHGTATVIGRRQVQYRPQPGFKGQDSVTVGYIGKQGGKAGMGKIHMTIIVR